jgi:GNAT superfamily N-acetyltransferase
MPARARPRRLVASIADDIVGWATSVFSFEGERTDVAFVGVTVREDVRRRGHGSDLFERCLTRVRADGATRALSEAVDPPGRRFLERRGFEETFERRVSALDPRAVDPAEVTSARARAAADGFTVVPFSECTPEEVYAVDAEAAADIPQDEPMTNVSFDEWRRRYWENPLRSFDGSFAVHHDDRAVAVTLLRADRERGRGANDMTGTLRAYRGRGLARLVKLCQAEWAAANGFTQLVTENDETNGPMLAVNERLGYRPIGAVYSYARELL